MTETDKIIAMLGGAKFVGAEARRRQTLLPALQGSV